VQVPGSSPGTFDDAAGMGAGDHQALVVRLVATLLSDLGRAARQNKPSLTVWSAMYSSPVNQASRLCRGSFCRYQLDFAPQVVPDMPGAQVVRGFHPWLEPHRGVLCRNRLPTYWGAGGCAGPGAVLIRRFDLLGAPTSHAGRVGDRARSSGQGLPCGGTAGRCKLPLLVEQKATTLVLCREVFGAVMGSLQCSRLIETGDFFRAGPTSHLAGDPVAGG